MPVIPRARRALVAAALAVAASARVPHARARPPDAVAPEKLACAQAYEAGQEERAGRRLRAARPHLVACAAAGCPAPMQRECAGWLAELEAAQPSVVVQARLPDGTDTLDVRVVVDGETLAERLDGSALDVDPGQRRFRFEHGGLPPVEHTVVVVEGDKRRSLMVELGSPAAERPAWPMYALGGVAIAGVATFAIAGLVGVDRYGELEDTCAPRCAQSDADGVSTTFLIADVSLVVGVAAAAGAAYLFFTRPGPKAPRAASRPAAGAVVTPRGVLAGARLAF